MSPIEPVEIVAFTRAISRSGFACGHAELDEWLRRYAGQQQASSNTRTFMAVHPEFDSVAGYYATTTYRLELDEVAAMHGTPRHRYPIPAVLLARLAVDSRCQGRGVGRQLLLHALYGLADASLRVGFEVVVVDAVDQDAAAFYGRHGFTPFADQPGRLYMTTAHLRATLAI